MLFIAPALRFDSLWPELLSRCRAGGHELGPIEQRSGWWCANLDHGRRLGLTSWAAVLEAIHFGLVQAGELSDASDVLQLRGLTDRMDEDAFLPLRSEELTAGRRVVQLCSLVDQAIDRLRAEGLADTTGLRATGGAHGSYHRYFKMHNTCNSLFYDPVGWSRRAIPITLCVRDSSWKGSKVVAEALGRLGSEVPSRLILDSKGASFVPIRLPLNVERDRVLDATVAQVREVAELIRCVPPVTGPAMLPAAQPIESA